MISKVIRNITGTGRDLRRTSDLESVSKWLQKAQAELDAAKVLSESSERLSEEATQVVISKFPDAESSSASLFASVPELESHSLKDDVSALLRFIIYCFVAGSTEPLEKVIGEISQILVSSSELSSIWYVEALKYIKDNHGLTGVAAIEANTYIDFMLNALS